jgi:hypothetical protein
MVLKRNLLGWRFEEYWFDAPGYLASTADIAALRSHGPAPAADCRIPERTLLVSLERPEEAILAGFAARAKTSIRQARKTVRVDRAGTPEERRLFYDAYLPFAAEKKLLVPEPQEERDLEIFLARDAEGRLLQAAAFLAAPGERVYRYRYGVYVRKSQANAILIEAAIRRARELGFAHFDLGGITPGARAGSPEAGINFFKSQFGGVDTASHLYLRGTRWSTRSLCRLLQATGLAARLSSLSALAARIAR